MHTSLHQHGDLTASWTFAKQIHYLIVTHILDVSLVDLHQNVPLFQTAAPWIVHYLLHPLATSREAIGNGEAETFVPLLHVDGDELRLGGYGRSQGDHVAGVTMGTVRCHLSRRAERPRLTQAVKESSLVCRRVKCLLPIDDDGFLVQDGHRGHQAGVRVVRVKGQWVATA